MWLIILIIIVIVIYKIIKGSNTQNNIENVTNGNNDDDIAMLEGFYDSVRANHKALGEKVISIGTYLFEMDGKVQYFSKHMSVCMREGTNDALAESIGMEVCYMEGKPFYQYRIRKDFSLAQKKEILKKLGERIAQKYTNDVVNYDDKIPSLYIMVDTKDFLEMLENAK